MSSWCCVPSRALASVSVSVSMSQLRAALGVGALRQ